MKIVNGKAKFGPNDYYEAREMFENGYPIFVDDIGAFGGGRGKVIGFDAEDANNYGEDFEDESEDPTLADQIVCIDKKIGQSDLNWGEWFSLFEDMWTPDFEYENWIERENMKTTRENESFSFKKTKMNLNEAKRVLRKNGFIVEAAEISIDDLIAFAKLNCSKAMGADVSVKDRCEWPLVEIDITGDAVFKKYNGTCITGYFKERTGAGARRGASKYFSIFPEESKLVVGPGTSERVNGKLCRLITNEYTYNSLDDLIKFFNRNNFNTTKLPKTFSEAKEILRKNGYRLVEDTDDWDEADMPAGMNAKDRKAMIDKHNDRNSLIDKKYYAGLWTLKLLATGKEFDEGDVLLGYLTPDLEVVDDMNYAVMNYEQVSDIYSKYANWDEIHGKLKADLKKQFPEYKQFWMEPGTVKHNRFYRYNKED